MSENAEDTKSGLKRTRQSRSAGNQELNSPVRAKRSMSSGMITNENKIQSKCRHLSKIESTLQPTSPVMNEPETFDGIETIDVDDYKNKITDAHPVGKNVLMRSAMTIHPQLGDLQVGFVEPHHVVPQNEVKKTNHKLTVSGEGGKNSIFDNLSKDQKKSQTLSRPPPTPTHCGGNGDRSVDELTIQSLKIIETTTTTTIISLDDFIRNFEINIRLAKIKPYIKTILTRCGFDTVRELSELDIGVVEEFVQNYMIEDMMKIENYNNILKKKLGTNFTFLPADKITLNQLIKEAKKRIRYEEQVIAVESESNSDYSVGSGNIVQLLKSSCYVDKSHYIQLLMDRGGFYNLYGPRRFGKTMVLDGIDTVCQGEESQVLFTKYKIMKNETYHWKKYPLIRMNFATQLTTKASFKLKLQDEIEANFLKYDIEHSTIDLRNHETSFNYLLSKVTQVNGYKEKVVILIDEFDYALRFNTLPHSIIDIREELDSFLLQCKTQLNSIHLLVYCGVMPYNPSSGKESGVTVNFLLNLPEFVNIIGFTETEIKTVFNNLLTSFASSIYEDFGNNEKEMKRDNIIQEIFADLKTKTKDLGSNEPINKWIVDQIMEKLKSQYNGYRFMVDTEFVYNPISVHSCLQSQKFDAYWHKTGVTTSILSYIRGIESYASKVRELSETEDPEFEIDIKKLDPGYGCEDSLEILLFRYGYLTIKVAKNVYTLGYPNAEVKNMLKGKMEEIYSSKKLDYGIWRSKMREKLFENDITAVVEFFNNQARRIDVFRFQVHYQELMCMLINGAQIDVEANMEMISGTGKTDLVLKCTEKNSPTSIYFIIEMKVLPATKYTQYNSEWIETQCKTLISGGKSQIERKQYVDKFIKNDDGTANKIITVSMVCFEKKLIYGVSHLMDELKPYDLVEATVFSYISEAVRTQQLS